IRDVAEQQHMSQANYAKFKDQREHIYKIPDTYIGNSVQSDREERVLDLSERKIIPYANIRESALTMIVALFPIYIDLPAARLVILLNLRRDFQINLETLRKRVKRFQEKLRKHK
ncbi:MAG: hypothetical protein KGD64_14115, partial [Candidatus Heimdallarchaeota archaeon]|nr:hypothetical protein [Candidatus Heimdallarchaeota archaeon]